MVAKKKQVIRKWAQILKEEARGFMIYRSSYTDVIVK